MAERRIVRVAQSFFEQLDSQLRPERGDAGEPSATDFLIIDLPPVIEGFATHFDELTADLSGVSAVRVLIASGVVVDAFAVYGVLMNDGTISLVGITIET